MTDLLYIADPNDETLLPTDPGFAGVDLNGLNNGSASGFGVVDGSLDIGQIDTEATWLTQGPAPGAVQIMHHHPIVEMQFALFVDGNGSYPTEVSLATSLVKALNRQGTIVWKPAEAAEARYIDYVPSMLPQLWRGQPQAMLKLLKHHLDTDGMPLKIWRWPYLRGPLQTLATAQVVSFASPTLVVTNPGDLPSECRITVECDGPADLVDVRVARRSVGNLTEAATLVRQSLGGVVANNTPWTRDATVVINPTDGTSLDGTWRVYGRVRFQAQSPQDGGQVQLKWGLVNLGDAHQQEDAVTLDTSDVANADLGVDYDVWLGYVTFDKNAPSLKLEVWSRGIPITWDELLLMPADEQFLDLATPGSHGGQFGKLIWVGTDLILSGSPLPYIDNDGHVILTQTGQVAKTDERPYEVGVRMAAPQGWVQENDRIFATIGHFLVKDHTGATVGSSKLRSRGRQYTSFAFAAPTALTWKISDNTLGYHFDVDFDSAPAAGRKLAVGRIATWFVPTVDAGRAMVLDGIGRGGWVGLGTERYWPLTYDQYLELEPGDNLLVLRLGDIFAANYDHVDEREPMFKVLSGRSVKVTVEVIPRHSH